MQIDPSIAGRFANGFAKRARKWGAIACAAVALYAAAGFWAVPALLRHQWPRIGNDMLARRASVGDVAFNPFTLRLVAQDLQLSERDGTPLFDIGQVVVEFQWRSLVRRAWSFSEVRLTAPNAQLTVAPDGRFNLAELIATLNKSPPGEKPSSELPRLVVEQFAIERGRVAMDDRRAGYTNLLSPIDFRLSNFSTLPDETDSYAFTAQSARGGKLRWKGRNSLNPIQGSGEFTLENVSLPEAAVYLKSYARATVAAGHLSATLPYSFSYADGKLEARLAGAQLSLGDLAIAREGSKDTFAAISKLDVKGVDADLMRFAVTVGEARMAGGQLAVRRDARGQLDVASLMTAAAGPAAASASHPAAASPVTSPVASPVASSAPAAWQLDLKQLDFDSVALSLQDDTASPPLKLATQLGVKLRLQAAQTAKELALNVSDASVVLRDTTLASGAQVPVRLGELGVTGGQVDLAARQARVEKAWLQDGKLNLVRDAKGALNVLALLPKAAPSTVAATAPAPVAEKPWQAHVPLVEVRGLQAALLDEASGIKLNLANIGARVEGASTDLNKPLKFDANVTVREGGQLFAQGSVVPATAAAQGDVRISKLALAPLQPLLAKHVRLTLASGSVSAQGRIATGAGDAKSPQLRYTGAFGVAGLSLVEDNGDLFAAWKDVRADKLTATVGPNLLDVPELRVVDANAKLIIEEDRSLNAARLLVEAPASPASAPAGLSAMAVAAPAPVLKAKPTTPAASMAPDAEPADPFPVRIRRLRLENAKLDFADLSLRPQFGAKIHELSGVINGLSTSPDTRSQLELDGRVDEFGLARFRGELNPFAFRRNTDVNVVFRNVDMVSASPYSMKFAGYRIAEGKISLDLQYKVRASQLVGANQIVLERLTLGERVESPDSLKLPLELALAILKDSEGRIDLGLPVEGNIDDPQFRYGPLVWKALANLIGKIASAPFRALGGLLGGGGEKFEAIEFDAGSGKLLPPERKKLRQVGAVLGKRPQLKLLVPGQYSEAADGAALRQRAVRLEVFKRAGVKLEAGDEPGPLDFGSRSVRSAVRELYAARFGEAELDKQKSAAESGAAAPAAGASAPAAMPVWRRVGAMVQGEPQVADAGAFYQALLTRLNKEQPLPADALPSLGAQRSEAILAAMKEAGVDLQRFAAAPPEKNGSPEGRMVGLKLGLAAR